jgi:hypothetical protein
MSLTDLAAIASVISSAAVAITLIFLALQVRQAEKNQRAMMQLGRADRVSSQALKVAEPSLALVFNKGTQLPEELTRDELDQFTTIARAMFMSAEDSFLQHKARLLDEAAYRSFVASQKFMLAAWPGLRAAWRMLSGLHDADFASFMNDLVSQAPPVPAPDRMAQWTAILQSENTGAGTRAEHEVSTLRRSELPPHKGPM